MPANNKKNPAVNLERDERIFELSRLGNSQRRVAEMVGVSQSTVKNVLRKYTEGRLHPQADEYRQQQIDRIHIYLRSLSSKVLAGDEKAIQSALRTEERLAKLLGLDSATAFHIDTTHTKDGDAIAVHKMIEQYFGRDKE